MIGQLMQQSWPLRNLFSPKLSRQMHALKVLSRKNVDVIPFFRKNLEVDMELSLNLLILFYGQ